MRGHHIVVAIKIYTSSWLFADASHVQNQRATVILNRISTHSYYIVHL